MPQATDYAGTGGLGGSPEGRGMIERRRSLTAARPIVPHRTRCRSQPGNPMPNRSILPAATSHPGCTWPRLVLVSLSAIFLAAESALTAEPAPAPEAGPVAEAGRPPADPADAARKAELLASSRWRRAVFEFNAWLDAQPVYSPAEVSRIRQELANRVATMSSFELEYLLGTLDEKVKVLESPEARDARSWLGRYLAVMSDAKRADVLRDVPDILDMSTAELEEAIGRVEAKRRDVEQQRAATIAGRQQIGGFLVAAREEEAAERARQAEVRSGPVFSPYRGPPVGDTPFSDAYDSPTVVGVGPWGTFLGIPIGAF